MELTKEQKMEQKIQLFMEHKIERDRAQASMDMLKESIIEEFRTMDDSVIRIGYDQDHDIKATFQPRVTRKLDKEQMAEDLEVEEKAINRDFLIKAADDRKLTFEQFKEYNFQETNDSLSVRLVKVEGKKNDDADNL